jgi:hypothetical protein
VELDVGCESLELVLSSHGVLLIVAGGFGDDEGSGVDEEGGGAGAAAQLSCQTGWHGERQRDVRVELDVECESLELLVSSHGVLLDTGEGFDDED